MHRKSTILICLLLIWIKKDKWTKGKSAWQLILDCQKIYKRRASTVLQLRNEEYLFLFLCMLLMKENELKQYGKEEHSCQCHSIWTNEFQNQNHCRFDWHLFSSQWQIHILNNPIQFDLLIISTFRVHFFIIIVRRGEIAKTTIKAVQARLTISM